MSAEKTYPVAAGVAEHAWADASTYAELYAASVEDPEAFWSKQAQRLEWLKPFTPMEFVCHRR